MFDLYDDGLDALRGEVRSDEIIGASGENAEESAIDRALDWTKLHGKAIAAVGGAVILLWFIFEPYDRGRLAKYEDEPDPEMVRKRRRREADKKRTKKALLEYGTPSSVESATRVLTANKLNAEALAKDEASRKKHLESRQLERKAKREAKRLASRSTIDRQMAA